MKIFYEQEKCLACRTCELACAVEHSEFKDLWQAILGSGLPRSRITLYSTLDFKPFVINCRHCQPAPCVEACISGALYKEGGETKFDSQRCVACWMCIMVCPFGVIKRQREAQVEKSFKCDLCPDREDYACVTSCPTKALSVKEEDKNG